VPAPARLVLITHPRRGARAFARRLVEERLAACVNRLPVESTYRWQGALEEASEVLLVLKTTVPRLAALERFLAREHPYQVFESVALDPVRVAPRYLSWLRAETGARRSP
jgi:periplasmic divalent cation tolerance protein